jgi:hypothetical protein
MLKRSHTFADIVAAGWAPSIEWLERRARRGDIKARKVGRVWRMTDDDVDAYIDSLANRTDDTPAPVAEPVPAQITPLRLTAASARRRTCAAP